MSKIEKLSERIEQDNLWMRSMLVGTLMQAGEQFWDRWVCVIARPAEESDFGLAEYDEGSNGAVLGGHVGKTLVVEYETPNRGEHEEPTLLAVLSSVLQDALTMENAGDDFEQWLGEQFDDGAQFSLAELGQHRVRFHQLLVRSNELREFLLPHPKLLAKEAYLERQTGTKADADVLYEDYLHRTEREV